MRLEKILCIIFFICHLTAAYAEKSEVNEMVRSVIKNGHNAWFNAWHLYLLKKNPEERIQGSEKSRELVIPLLLKKNNIDSILLTKSIDLNTPAIIDSCKLRIGLHTEERYDLFCGAAPTPVRSLVDLNLTPLQATCITGDLAAMKLLLKAGADIEGGPAELSPLVSCLTTRNYQQVDFLIDQGADVKESNLIFTHLQILSMESKYNFDQDEAARLAEKLIAKGADPHYLNKEKYGELEAAVVFNNLAVVKVLVKHGVDINAKTNKGITLLSLAEKKNHVAIVDFLESKGAKR
jgi:hypothetical protein